MKVQDEYLRICPEACIVNTSVLNQQVVLDYIQNKLGVEYGIRNKSKSA